MTDTQKAMREEFLKWLQQPVAETDCNVFQALIGHCDNDAWWAWQAATAQSAEKIARLEAEKKHLLDIVNALNADNHELVKQLTAAELSNTQLRDVLEDFARGQLQVPNFEAYVQATAKSALAQQPSTEALDAYVASKLPAWQPIETAPNDGTYILVTNGHRMYVDFWLERLECWNASAHGESTHWMPLPPSPKQKG